MSIFLRGISILFFILLLVILEIGFSYLLPYPWSKINILFVILIILMLWWENGIIVWLAFFSHFFIELFTVSPFGVILFSGTMSILLGYWLYKIVFTNRSWYASIILSFFTLLIYRLLYIILLSFIHLFGNFPITSWQSIFITIGWELFLTTITIAMLYLLISLFSQKLNVTIIQNSPFKF